MDNKDPPSVSQCVKPEEEQLDEASSMTTVRSIHGIKVLQRLSKVGGIKADESTVVVPRRTLHSHQCLSVRSR